MHNAPFLLLDIDGVFIPFPAAGGITTSHPDGYLWKRNHVADWLAGAPAIWIDDDFTSLDHQWAADRTTFGNPTLLIEPDPHVGIQPEHIMTALEWASALTPTARAA